MKKFRLITGMLVTRITGAYVKKNNEHAGMQKGI